jgi:hypothetical protein
MTGRVAPEEGGVAPGIDVTGPTQGGGGAGPTGLGVHRPGAAGSSGPGGTSRPWYARILRLRFTNPNWMVCLLLLEGSAVLAVLAWLADVVDWWGVPVIPVTVAGMVKLHDLFVGVLVRSGLRSAVATAGTPTGRAAVPVWSSPSARGWAAQPGDQPSWTWPTVADGHRRVARGVARVTGRDQPTNPGMALPEPTEEPSETPDEAARSDIRTRANKGRFGE